MLHQREDPVRLRLAASPKSIAHLKHEAVARGCRVGDLIRDVLRVNGYADRAAAIAGRGETEIVGRNGVIEVDVPEAALLELKHEAVARSSSVVGLLGRLMRSAGFDPS